MARLKVLNSFWMPESMVWLTVLGETCMDGQDGHRCFLVGRATTRVAPTGFWSLREVDGWLRAPLTCWGCVVRRGR